MNYLKRVFVSLAVIQCSTLISHSALASPDEDLMLLYQDEEMINIATGTTKPIHLAPSVASVITAKDIKEMGARTLDEALEMVPGLHVATSFNRLNSIYSIRGIHTKNSPQVLMLMNGRPFQALFAGTRPNNFRLPSSNISRIEIIRGPGSAVYGADAFAGVINIITKDANEIDGTLTGARVGSFNSQDVWIQHGTQQNDIDIAFSIDYSHSDGDENRIIEIDDGARYGGTPHTPGPLDTRYKILNSELKLDYKNWSTKLWGWKQINAGNGPGAAQALDPSGRTDVENLLLDISYMNIKFTENWEFGSHLSFNYQRLDSEFIIFPPTSTIGPDTYTDGYIGRPGSIDNSSEFEVLGFFNGFKSHRWRLAAGVKYQQEKAFESKNYDHGGTPGDIIDVTGTSYIYIEDQYRTATHLSIQDEWRLAPDWELTGGIRYDYYSDFGGTLNPRLALVWATSYNLTTKLLYGRAFRPPSFNELYAQNNPSIKGNENLKPEVINTLELAFDYKPNFELDTLLNLFYYEIEDAIDFTGAGNLAENAVQQKGYGFEVEAQWEPTKYLELIANYAWQHAKDTVTDQPIADAPPRQFYILSTWQLADSWSISAKANWIGDRERLASDSRSDIKDYTLVDITLRRKYLRENWEIATSIRNLFDEDANEPSDGKIPNDYPLAGRSVYVEVSYKFDY